MKNLILSRHEGESIEVNGPCVITVVRLNAINVRLSIKAEPDVQIMRSELLERPVDENDPKVVL